MTQKKIPSDELDEIVDLLFASMGAIALSEADAETLRTHLKRLIYWERRMTLMRVQQLLGNTRADIEHMILPQPKSVSEDYRFGAMLRRIHNRYLEG